MEEIKVTQHSLDPILPLSVSLHVATELPGCVRGPPCVMLDDTVEIYSSPRDGVPGTPRFSELNDPLEIGSSPYCVALDTPRKMTTVQDATSPLNSVGATVFGGKESKNTSDTRSSKQGRHSKLGKSILRTSCTFIERTDRVDATGKAINILKQVSQYCSSVKEEHSSVQTERIRALESHKSDILAEYETNINAMDQGDQKSELYEKTASDRPPCTPRARKSHFAVSFADQVPVTEFSGGTAKHTTTRNLTETKLVDRYVTADMVFRPRLFPETFTYVWSTPRSSVCTTLTIIVFIVTTFMFLLIFYKP
eukprot:GEMP01033002.1.p1 GENE.GEMP01033002.1~~GEMP01033002.1.p1  ORF type:complete len:309 (+),score=43.86 GEMP01033002.1:89-1015(+)